MQVPCQAEFERCDLPQRQYKSLMTNSLRIKIDCLRALAVPAGRVILTPAPGRTRRFGRVKVHRIAKQA